MPHPQAAMRHVLVVDDEPAICDVLQMALTADGTCRVSTASNVGDAITTLTADPPHAAIIDAALPRVSGLTLADHLAAWGIPVLIMTGEPEYQDELRKFDVAFIKKPTRMQQVVTETRLLLDEASQRMVKLRAGLDRLKRLRSEMALLHEASRALLERVRAEREARAQADFHRLSLQQATCDEFVREAVQATAADCGTLQIAGAAAAAQQGLVASTGFATHFIEFLSHSGTSEDSSWDAAFSLGCRIVVPDICESPIFIGKSSGHLLRAAGVRAVQSTPILGNARDILGTVSTYKRSTWCPTEAQFAQLDRIVSRIAVEIEPPPVG